MCLISNERNEFSETMNKKDGKEIKFINGSDKFKTNFG